MSEAAVGRRCAPVLVILVGLVGLVLAAVVLPWLQRNALYDDAIEERGRQLERYLAMLDRLPALERQLAAVRDSRALDAFYLEADNAANGGIALQRRVEELIGGAGGTLTSIQILPPSGQEAVVKVSVRLRFSGTTDALQRLLYAVESNQPFLFVNNLDVRSLRRNTRVRPGKQQTSQSDLNVNLDVSGYIRKQAA